MHWTEIGHVRPPGIVVSTKGSQILLSGKTHNTMSAAEASTLADILLEATAHTHRCFAQFEGMRCVRFAHADAAHLGDSNATHPLSLTPFGDPTTQTTMRHALESIELGSLKTKES